MIKNLFRWKREYEIEILLRWSEIVPSNLSLKGYVKFISSSTYDTFKIIIKSKSKHFH